MESNLSTKKRVAANVRAELARLGYAKEALAEVLQLSVPTIRRRLSGDTEFTISELEATAEWLSISPAELILQPSRSRAELLSMSKCSA